MGKMDRCQEDDDENDSDSETFWIVLATLHGKKPNTWLVTQLKDYRLSNQPLHTFFKKALNNKKALFLQVLGNGIVKYWFIKWIVE